MPGAPVPGGAHGDDSFLRELSGRSEKCSFTVLVGGGEIANDVHGGPFSAAAACPQGHTLTGRGERKETHSARRPPRSSGMEACQAAHVGQQDARCHRPSRPSQVSRVALMSHREHRMRTQLPGKPETTGTNQKPEQVEASPTASSSPQLGKHMLTLKAVRLCSLFPSPRTSAWPLPPATGHATGKENAVWRDEGTEPDPDVPEMWGPPD